MDTPISIGIFAKVLSRPDLDLENMLRELTDYGLHHVQFNMSCVGLPSMPDHIPAELADRIGRSCQHHGITMEAVSGTFNMIHPDVAVVERGLARLKVLAAACQPMGTAVITLCTGTRDPDDMWRGHPDNNDQTAWDDLLRALERALRSAEAEDVYLAIEPEQANVIDSALKARKLLDHFRSPRLKIIIDAANLFEHGAPAAIERVVAEACDLLASEIVIAHAKDRAANGAFVAAGNGVLNYDHYIAQLRRIKFQGALILHGLNEREINSCVNFLSSKLRTL